MTVVMASLSVAGSADGGVELAHLGVQAFQRVMARFEGAAKVLVDNKGVTLSGAFGLPPRAHADDARRAITAAETLRRELEDIGLSCTVGVATGRAFCGIFGSDLRREYTLHGEVVNLASRLMEASERRDPLLRRHRAGGARERRLRGAGAGHAEGARRAGGGAPRNVDAQRRQRPRVADGRARGRAGGDQGTDRRPGDRRPLGHRRHRGRGRAGQVAARRRRRSAWRGRAACACSPPPPMPSRTPRATTPGARCSPTCSRSPRRRWSIRTPSRCRAIRSCGGCARCSAASFRSASPTTS